MYEYDVFLSYTRSGGSGDWVRDRFHPLLVDALDNHMDRSPAVFIDSEQHTGLDWPNNLRRALGRSRLMVAVLSPPYFRSDWCRAEWATMCGRHDHLELGTDSNPTVLIHPVVFKDGKHFPPATKRFQHRDFKRWACPLPAFEQTAKMVELYEAVDELAQTLAVSLDEAPEWDSRWPVLLDPAPAAVTVPAAIPRL